MFSHTCSLSVKVSRPDRTVCLCLTHRLRFTGHDDQRPGVSRRPHGGGRSCPRHGHPPFPVVPAGRGDVHKSNRLVPADGAVLSCGHAVGFLRLVAVTTSAAANHVPCYLLLLSYYRRLWMTLISARVACGGRMSCC